MLYEVSNLGSVRRDGKCLKGDTLKGGYRRVGLYLNGRKTRRLVQHLVLEAFEGPCPEGLEASHLDGNPENNRLDNLEWSTHQENMSRRKLHGTVPAGERSGTAVLTENDVRAIRHLRASGKTYKEIGMAFGVTLQNIFSITNGRTWTHV